MGLGGRGRGDNGDAVHAHLHLARTYQGLICGTDRIVMPAEGRGSCEIDTTNRDVEFLSDFYPVGSGFRVGVGVVCASDQRRNLTVRAFAITPWLLRKRGDGSQYGLGLV